MEDGGLPMSMAPICNKAHRVKRKKYELTIMEVLALRPICLQPLKVRHTDGSGK